MKRGLSPAGPDGGVARVQRPSVPALELGAALQTGWLSRKRHRHIGVAGGSRRAPRSASTSSTLALTAAQRAVVGLVREGSSLFLTGAAGTGKSEVLRALASRGGVSVAVTALTGSAAVLLGGQTLHAWAGIGRADLPADVLAQRVLQDASAHERWCSTSLLIVDEVSMVSGSLLDKLDAVGRAARRQPKKAFGGLQVLFCGDFHQLPPPGVHTEGWAFEARCWNTLVETVVELTEVVRLEAGELAFARVLEQVRSGSVDDEAWSALGRLVVPPAAAQTDRGCIDGATHLVPTNAEADKVNKAALQQLFTRASAAQVGQPTARTDVTDDPSDQRMVEFIAQSVGPRDSSRAAFCAPTSSAGAPATLNLGVGAQVVLTQSLCLGPDKDGLTGSAWGDWALCTASHIRAFENEPGVQERLTNGTRCQVVGFCHLADRLYDPRAAGFEGAELSLPLRRFLLKHGGLLPRVAVPGAARDYVVYPVASGGGGADSGLVQLPLRLGWALTVHRAQGMTLSACVVHLRGISSSGQAYVALSRCRRASQLRILGGLPERNPRTGRVAAFAPAKKVAEFYAALGRAE